MSSDLTDTLLSIQNPDANVRVKAETLLKNLEKIDFRKYIHLLCTELASQSKPPQSVTLAGILLKNAVDAKNPQLRNSLHQRWLSIPNDERAKIRNGIFTLLTSPIKSSREVAALVVSKIAAVELNDRQWPEVADNLFQLTANNSDGVQAAAFRTLSFLSEDCPLYMAGHVNRLLDVCCTICKNENPLHLKAEAFSTLYHALNFSEEIIAVQKQCDFIMSVVFQLLKSGNTTLAVIAFDCFARITELYYNMIGPYVPMILQLSSEALTNASTPLSVQLRAIEFWATLAEVEHSVLLESRELKNSTASMSAGGLVKCHNLIKQSLPQLLPVLLEAMSRHGDEVLEGDSDIAADTAAPAAGGCLSLIVQSVDASFVQMMMPYLQQNLDGPDWRKQEAALSALGIMIDGPPVEAVRPIVSQALSPLSIMASKGKPPARDSASWSLARICRRFGGELIVSDQLGSLITALCLQLDDPRPKVAANGCWAISCLAGSVKPHAATSPLTPNFKNIVNKLIQTAQRPDRYEHHLEASAYESVGALILTSPDDCSEMVRDLTDSFIGELGKSLQKSSRAEVRNRTELNNLQALVIATLSASVKVLPEKDVLSRLDTLMSVLYGVLQSQDKTIFEEVLLAIGVIVIRVKTKFSPYFGKTLPFISMGLRYTLGSNVCDVSVGLVNDIFNVLGSQYLNEADCDQLMELLLSLISNPSADRSIKPHIVSCIGDIALALDVRFVRYFDLTMKLLTEISEVQINVEFADNIDFANDLRASLFETYTMTLLSMKNAGKTDRFVSSAMVAMNLAERLVSFEDRSDHSVASALEFVGDLCDVMKSDAKPLINTVHVRRLLELGRSSHNERVKKAHEWALKTINGLSSI